MQPFAQKLITSSAALSFRRGSARISSSAARSSSPPRPRTASCTSHTCTSSSGHVPRQPGAWHGERHVHARSCGMARKGLAASEQEEGGRTTALKTRREVGHARQHEAYERYLLGVFGVFALPIGGQRYQWNHHG